jgi:hypothetical protein
MTQWNQLTQLLTTYEGASRQRLNNNKTAIFFSKNTPQTEKEEIVKATGILVIQRNNTYLGLMALVGRSKVAAFKTIK